MGRERGARRKAGLALITALALVVSGIPATTASAANTSVLAGQVVLPADFEPAGLRFVLSLYKDEGGDGAGKYVQGLWLDELDLSLDELDEGVGGLIPFEFTGLEVDAHYRIELHDTRAELTTGFYVANDQSLTSRPSSATLLRPGRTDLTVLVVEGAVIKGDVQLPEVEGAFRPKRIGVYARNLDRGGSVAPVSLTDPGTGGSGSFQF